MRRAPGGISWARWRGGESHTEETGGDQPQAQASDNGPLPVVSGPCFAASLQALVSVTKAGRRSGWGQPSCCVRVGPGGSGVSFCHSSSPPGPPILGMVSGLDS